MTFVVEAEISRQCSAQREKIDTDFNVASKYPDTSSCIANRALNEPIALSWCIGERVPLRFDRGDFASGGVEQKNTFSVLRSDYKVLSRRLDTVVVVSVDAGEEAIVSR